MSPARERWNRPHYPSTLSALQDRLVVQYQFIFGNRATKFVGGKRRMLTIEFTQVGFQFLHAHWLLQRIENIQTQRQTKLTRGGEHLVVHATQDQHIRSVRAG